MGKVKVLYVEDEPFLARIVKESLESRDLVVHLINDGAQAMQAFNNFQPDICVLDVMLPHKDGFTIASDIRKINPQIPIIFLTAKVQTEDLVKGFESGGNDYLRKPFSMEELIVRIHNLLQLVSQQSLLSSGRTTSGKIILGRYVFYPSRYELHLDQRVRKLSHRENSLLQLLTKDIDNPVLRREILLNIWGDDSFYNSRNLDVYISRLRDYLSEDPNIQIITIKGVGYHFRC
jgi:two-component system, OmpR family, response regulator VicR